MLTIRSASKRDKEDFARLLIMSAQYFPQLFGKNIEQTLQKLFVLPKNLFSYEHVTIAEADGHTAAMALGYGYKEKKKENLHTGYLLFCYHWGAMISKLPTFLSFNSSVGQLAKEQFYLSNIAVYPKYRGRGIGKILMQKALEQAKKQGYNTMVLDVEKYNNPAISLYKKLGFEIINEFKLSPIKGKQLTFYRMVKGL